MKDVTLEIERTFLAKYIPKLIVQCKYADFHDLYVPAVESHPKLRIRNRGGFFEITKKVPMNLHDASQQREMTIPLTQLEYDELVTAHGKKITKRRYYIPVEGKIAEMDIFLDNLYGLVLIDFEFPNEFEKDSFVPPDFCLAEVTHEAFVAGGMLAGKTYEEISPYLVQYGYEPLAFQPQ